MNERRILLAIFLLLALGTGYMTVVLWRADETGKELFLGFTLFFIALAVAPIVAEFRRAPTPEATPPTRFVSHRFMTLIAALLVLGVLAAIVVPLLKN